MKGELNDSRPGLLAAAWRYRRLVIGVIALSMGLAVAISVLRPQDSQYSASATVVIQEPITSETVGQQGTSITYLSSQLELIRSPVVAEAALEIVREIEPSAISDDELPEVTIVGSIESPLVSVDVVASTPELAVTYANAVAEAYREVGQRQATSTSEAQLARIDAQVKGIDERLREIERTVADFVANDSGLAELQSQADDAVAEIARLHTLLLNDTLPAEEAEAMRQRIQDNRQVIVVYGDVLEGTSSNPERRALEEEQAQQVGRRASLLTRRDEIAVDMGLVPDAIALIQPASAAMELPGMDLARVLGTGMIVGAAAGLGLAHMLTMSRRTLVDRTEPGPILGAPLIAEVPDFEQEGISSPVPVRDHPRSAAAEAYRFASLTLDVAARAHFARSIFVASSTLGRGKTTTVVNTAVASAINDRSVLVIDCDFGNQEATRLLVGDHHGSLFGVTDIIEGHAKASKGIHEVVLPTGASLHVMPRGTRPSSAATTLQSTRARDLISLLTREYELVLIDGPPLLQVAYASTLAELAEGALIVAEHRSRHSELIELKSRLDLVGTPVLGYIYNRSPLRREMTLSEGSMMDTLGAGLEERVLAGRNRDTG